MHIAYPQTYPCHRQQRTHDVCLMLQVRSFLELKDSLLSMELPQDTRQAWVRFL